MRILTKGFTLPGVEHTAAEWDEPQNTKDYEVVFLDLDAIFERNTIVAPTSDVPQAIEFPDTDDVIDLLRAGNELYIFLPRSRYLDVLAVDDGETTESTIDLLSWLPFDISSTEEQGQSVASESVSQNWQWYFDRDFDWPMYFSRIAPDEDAFRLATDLLTASKSSIAQTAFEKDIAAQFTATDLSDIVASLSREGTITYSGQIFVLPIPPSYSAEGATKGILQRNYQMDIDTTVTEPDWASDQELPRQREIVETWQSLKREYDELKEYRKLLYEKGDELETVVLDAFEELGFETRPEIHGKRDGMVLTEETAYVLETHGTENATRMKKVSQLNRWVRGAKDDVGDEFENIVGLLVGNAYRTDPPEERRQPIAGDPIDDLRDHGFKYLPTVELYRALKLSQQDDISRSEICAALQEAKSIVSLSEDER